MCGRLRRRWRQPYARTCCVNFKTLATIMTGVGSRGGEAATQEHPVAAEVAEVATAALAETGGLVVCTSGCVVTHKMKCGTIED